MSDTKNPVLVEAGRRGAERRWGPPGTRTVKLGELTPEQRRLVLALVDAAKSEAATATNGDGQEVDRASDHTTAQRT